MKLELNLSLLISLATSELIIPESDLLPPAGQRDCKVHGDVKDTSCNYQTIDETNDVLSPLLDQLVQRKFFRYYKVNLHKKCNFWNADMKCNRPDCAVEEVEDLVSY
jgi:hypothetical protein